MIGAPTFTQLAARLPGARLQGADLALHTISTDTRTLVAGDVLSLCAASVLMVMITWQVPSDRVQRRLSSITKLPGWRCHN